MVKFVLKWCWHGIKPFLPYRAVLFGYAAIRAFREMETEEKAVFELAMRSSLRAAPPTADHRLQLDAILREMLRLHARLDEIQEMKTGMPGEEWSQRSDAA